MCFSKSLRISISSGVLALSLLSITPKSAEASFLINVSESSGNVIAIGIGAINTSSLSFVSTGSLGSPGLAGSVAYMALSPTTNPDFFIYSGVSGPANFGSSAFLQANSGTGDLVVISGDQGQIFLPFGYSSNTALSGSATWTGASFASLGITPGTYTYNWGSGGTADSLTVQIGPASSSAPEPGTLALLALGGTCAFVRRRRCLG
jgi:PEP-CTERM motif